MQKNYIWDKIREIARFLIQMQKNRGMKTAWLKIALNCNTSMLVLLQLENLQGLMRIQNLTKHLHWP